MSSFTPGPWIVSKQGNVIRAANGDFICDLNGVALSNVPVLAAAAEMLEALQSVINDLEWGTTGRWKGDGSKGLRAAIAKATGKD